MKIGEVCKLYNISSDTLRYYEKIGLIGEVPVVHGKREYAEKHLATVDFVVCMRRSGMTIKTLSQYLKLYRSGESCDEARRALLIEQRDELVKKLEDIQTSIDRLNYKIDQFDVIVKAEHNL